MAQKHPSVAHAYPELCKEWHSKNTVSPYEVTAGSSKKVWWQCGASGHVWQAVVNNRVRGSGCPRCNQGWTIENIRHFISSLVPHLETMTQAELHEICRQSGSLYTTGKAQELIKDIVSGAVSRERIDRIIDDSDAFEKAVSTYDNASSEDDEAQLAVAQAPSADAEDPLPYVETHDILASLDTPAIAGFDDEAIIFLVRSAVARIWCHAVHDEVRALEQLEQYTDAGVYAQRVKDTFWNEYKAAKQLEIPAGYNPHPRYVPRKEHIRLMQRHVACQIAQRKRFGNWCDTGTGKTLSAILATRVIDARLTLICCPITLFQRGSVRLGTRIRIVASIPKISHRYSVYRIIRITST